MFELKLGDCKRYLKDVPSKSIDLIVTDPPYVLNMNGGGSTRLSLNKRAQKKQLAEMIDGIDNEILDELCRVLKKINIYMFCSKSQLRQFIEYFEDKGCFWNLITWHKDNAIPACNNTFVSDVEYVFFAREKGVPLYGDCKTKTQCYTTHIVQKEKALYKHPTIKPVFMLENFILNSSKEDDMILDPFMGSGSTGVAAVDTKRNFLGFEINKDYYDTAYSRIKITEIQNSNELVLFGG